MNDTPLLSRTPIRGCRVECESSLECRPDDIVLLEGTWKLHSLIILRDGQLNGIGYYFTQCSTYFFFALDCKAIRIGVIHGIESHRHPIAHAQTDLQCVRYLRIPPKLFRHMSKPQVKHFPNHPHHHSLDIYPQYLNFPALRPKFLAFRFCAHYDIIASHHSRRILPLRFLDVFAELCPEAWLGFGLGLYPNATVGLSRSDG